MTTLQEIIIPPLAVVCHDAGAANLIVHWIKGYQGDVLVCMEGPAKIIWNSHFSEVELLPMRQVIKGVNTLLSGTGWGDLEYHARIEAKKRNIYNIAVIDHWTSYQKRFIRNKKEVLPDLILVSDKYAKKKADNIFPCTRVEELENAYLNNEAKKVMSMRASNVNKSPRKILAVMEPFREMRYNGNPLEFASLKYLISNLSKVTKDESVEICLRMHPSESIGKYDYFVKKYPNIKISNNIQLHSDLAWADLVVGMQSFAMVVSQHCNIPTISIIPPDSIGCILPYREILSLRDL